MARQRPTTAVGDVADSAGKPNVRSSFLVHASHSLAPTSYAPFRSAHRLCCPRFFHSRSANAPSPISTDATADIVDDVLLVAAASAAPVLVGPFVFTTPTALTIGVDVVVPRQPPSR